MAKAKFLNAGIALALAGTAAAPAQEPRPVPYWASISAGDALMRTGPGANYPATWRYRRPNLPIRVLQIHESWRRVRDPDGIEGWMASALLTAKRTAIVVGEVRPMLAEPKAGAKLAWRAEPGVVGAISKCTGGWCAFDVKGQSGYIRVTGLWGVNSGEVVE